MLKGSEAARKGTERHVKKHGKAVKTRGSLWFHCCSLCFRCLSWRFHCLPDELMTSALRVGSLTVAVSSKSFRARPGLRKPVAGTAGEGGREGGRERNGWSGRETADQCRNGRACESESDSPAQFEDGMECLATPVTSRSRPDRRFSHRCGLQTHDSNGWDTVRLTKSLLELWARERRQRLHALMERPERGVPACVPPAPGWVSAML